MELSVWWESKLAKAAFTACVDRAGFASNHLNLFLRFSAFFSSFGQLLERCRERLFFCLKPGFCPGFFSPVPLEI